jgi:hypothetical protein
MKKAIGANDFLQNMAQGETVAAPVEASEITKQASAGQAAKSRDGLKHIGGKLPFFEPVSVSTIPSC